MVTYQIDLYLEKSQSQLPSNTSKTSKWLFWHTSNLLNHLPKIARLASSSPSFRAFSPWQKANILTGGKPRVIEYPIVQLITHIKQRRLSICPCLKQGHFATNLVLD